MQIFEKYLPHNNYTTVLIKVKKLYIKKLKQVI